MAVDLVCVEFYVCKEMSDARAEGILYTQKLQIHYLDPSAPYLEWLC